jgi:hypothetical protein
MLQELELSGRNRLHLDGRMSPSKPTPATADRRSFPAPSRHCRSRASAASSCRRATELQPPKQATMFLSSPVSNTVAHVSLSSAHPASTSRCLSYVGLGHQLELRHRRLSSPPHSPLPLQVQELSSATIPEPSYRRQCPESRTRLSFNAVQCFPSETTRATVPGATSLR